MAQLARVAASDPDFVRIAYLLLRGDIDSVLRSVYRYRSEYEEIIRTPQFMLHDLQTKGFIEGDCDDIATLSAALLLVAGYRSVRFVAIIYTPGKDSFEHVYVEVYEAGQWRTVDLTIDPGVTHREIERMTEDV